MGQDIHAYVEYGDALTHTQLARFRLARWYDLFAFMGTGGSSRRPNIQPSFPLRGVPGEMNIFTAAAYQDTGSDAHHASWLTYVEAVQVRQKYLEWFREKHPASDLPTLEDYRAMLAAMLALENMGYTTRVVFWFDN